MSGFESSKEIPIYFYYLTIAKTRSDTDDFAYNIQDILAAFSRLLNFLIKKNLNERSFKLESAEKVIWLDTVEDLTNGNYNLVFKSAKYNHVRNEIDTNTMVELGTRRKPHEGEEEKTHLCVRLHGKNDRFLAVHESNHYGISISTIATYLNNKLEVYNEETDDKYHYRVSYEIMPGDDFLSELKKAKSISLLTLTVDKEQMSDWLKFAGRADISEDIEITIKRPFRKRNFPDNLIKEYYQDMQQASRIKGIYVKGSRQSGSSFTASTDLVKMKHSLNVGLTTKTKEVDSSDFFSKAQSFINESRKKL